jgi:hypothetical protein
MKRIGLVAGFAALAAASAYAQQVFEPAVPRGVPENRVEPSGELAQPAQAPVLVMNVRHQQDADARRCLQLASNRQIHRCAQPYLPAAARARLVKTTAKTDSAPASSRARASDLAKPDMSRAAEPAKPVDTAKPAAQAAAQPGSPPRTADVVKSAPAADKSGNPKWSDNAKGVMQKQGERLTNRLNEEK